MVVGVMEIHHHPSHQEWASRVKQTMRLLGASEEPPAARRRMTTRTRVPRGRTHHNRAALGGLEDVQQPAKKNARRSKGINCSGKGSTIGSPFVMMTMDTKRFIVTMGDGQLSGKFVGLFPALSDTHCHINGRMTVTDDDRKFR